jgi:hypothetical protein
LAVYGPPTGALNQGDLIGDVPFIARRLHDQQPITLPGLITSNSCDLDKFAKERPKLERNQMLSWPATVAPVYDLDSLDAGGAGDVRGDRHRRYFLLPREGQQPEQMADLWLQQPVPICELERLPRLATLSDEWLRRLWLHAFVTLTRRDPKAVFVGGTLSA